LVALVAASLMTAFGAYAQMELPKFVEESVGTIQIQGMGPVQNMTVSNVDYQRFQPNHVFESSMGYHPAVVTRREAEDYVTSTGKRMGVDYVWRALPRSEKGIIYIISEGMEISDPDGGATVKNTAPAGMVYVPEGIFTMGSDNGDPDESPKHQESTKPFYIDKFEVSNAEFKAVFPEFQFGAGLENHAAIVDWNQAVAYAAKVGKRLPTELEWEKAARGTDGRTFPWGESHDLSFVAWDEKVPRGGAIARPESPYGCVDMAGGAWEWTADWYKPYIGNETPADEYGETYKVIRGGASFNDIAMCRTTQRYYLPADTTAKLHVGFRCVKDYETPSAPAK